MKINITEILSDLKEKNDKIFMNVIIKEVKPKLIGNKHEYPIFSVDLLINNNQKINLVNKSNPIYEDNVKDLLSLISKKQREFNIEYISVDVKSVSKIYELNYRSKFSKVLYNDIEENDIAILIKDIDENQLKKLTIEQQKNLFLSFCQYGNSQLVFKMIEHSFLANHENCLNNKSLTKKEIDEDRYFLNYAIEKAAYGGYLDIIKALLEYKVDILISNAIVYAIFNDKSDVLDFFFYEAKLVDVEEAGYILKTMYFDNKEKEISVKNYFKNFINDNKNIAKKKKIS